MEQRIKGTTGLLALIGSPVGHSGSPDMYNFCFRYHNLDYSYMAFDIKEDQVPAALDAMRLFKMRGCNVTMPCKTAAAQNMDELSPAARIIGAVNTIVNENGKLIEEELRQREEINELIMTEDAIEMTYHLEHCPNCQQGGIAGALNLVSLMGCNIYSEHDDRHAALAEEGQLQPFSM